MGKAGYAIPTGGLVALSANVAKSILGASAPASFGLDLIKYKISFDGTLPTAAPVLIELCAATFVSNAPGTQSTLVTPQQIYGRTMAPGFTAAKAWVAGNEPTVLTPIDEHWLSPFGGSEWYDAPLGTSADSAPSQGFVIRCTAPAGVNARATMSVERC